MRRGATVASETRDIPALSIRADVAPATLDEEQRTVEVVFTTGAKVARMDFWTGRRWIESLSLDPAHVRLGRLNNGAPVLDSHSGWSIMSQLGVVVNESAKLLAKEGRATLRFAKDDEESEKAWNKVRQRIVRNVSIGYLVHKYEESGGENGKPLLRHAVDWEPFEISMVPIPADARSQVRGDELETNPCLFVRAYSVADAAHYADEDRARRLRLAQAQTR